jgi:hypothetical protein
VVREELVGKWVGGSRERGMSGWRGVGVLYRDLEEWGGGGWCPACLGRERDGAVKF